MSSSFHCGTCLLHSTSHCPHGIHPDRDFCTSYAPAGAVWDDLRPTLCNQCPQHSGGICGLSGMPAENTPSSECVRHKAILQLAWEQTHSQGSSDDMAAYPGMSDYSAPAPAPVDDDMAAYPGMTEFMQGGMASGLMDAPASGAPTTAAPAPAPVDDDMAAYPGMTEFMQGGMASGLTDAPASGAPTTAAPAPAPVDDDMAAYPGMTEFMQGGMASGLMDAPMADVPAGQPQQTTPRQPGGQQRNRRAAQHQGGQQRSQGAQQGQRGTQQHGGKQTQHGTQHQQGHKQAQHGDRQQQHSSKPTAKKPSPHLYFLNPCSILGMLFIFLAFGFFFCVPQWQAVPWQTGVCILGAMAAVSLVAGLVWGIMNPQCRPVQFALAACMGVGAGRMFWQGAPFKAMLFAISAGFAVMVLCFCIMRLGVLITNAIFRVKKRMAKILPTRSE